MRERIWEIAIGLVFVTLLALSLRGALQPVSLEQYVPTDTGTDLRLKLNRNEDRTELALNANRMKIDTARVLAFRATVKGSVGQKYLDTILLPQKYVNNDFQVSVTAVTWYGSAPTAGISASALTDSSLLVNMGGTNDSTRVQVIAVGSMLGRE
jgi:hypothetical protein